MRAGDFLLAARMLRWRIWLPIVLHRRPVRDVVAGPVDAPRRADPGDEAGVQRLARRLWRSSTGTCLERSVALYLELRRLGAQPRLVLGLAPAGERIGHAWVELAGRPILESTDPRSSYAELVAFAPDGSVVRADPAAGGAPGAEERPHGAREARE